MLNKARRGLIPPGLGPKRYRILEVALGELGVREKPPRTNRGPELDRYLPAWARKAVPGPAWCCYFVCWVLKTSLGRVPTGRMRGRSLVLFEDAKACGLDGVDFGLAMPGDVFVMDVGAPGGEGHVGFILRVSDDGAIFETVEGNSGNRVRVGLRRADEPGMVGFIETVPDEWHETYARGLSGKGVPTSKLATR